MAIDVLIPLDAWPALVELAPPAGNPVSPLGLTPTAPVSPEASSAALRGALEAADVPVEALQDTLAVLAAPTGACRVQVGGARLVELTTFASSDGGPLLSLATESAGLRLQDPAPLDDHLVTLEHLIGSSAIRGVELEAELTVPEALVLAAILDERRAAVLRSLLDGQPAAAVSLTPTAVRAAVAERATRVFWLTGVVVDWCLADAALSASAVHDALESLAAKGFVRSGRHVELADDATELATRLLLVEKVVSLLRVIPHGADVARSALNCLQFGVHDLLTVELVRDTVRLETVPANLLLGYLDTFLRDPLAGAAEPAAAPPAPPAPAAWAPTHTVPAAGLIAWERPDPAAPSVQLAARTPLRVESTLGAWARVSAENGWTGWVDGRLLGVVPDEP